MSVASILLRPSAVIALISLVFCSSAFATEIVIFQGSWSAAATKSKNFGERGVEIRVSTRLSADSDRGRNLIEQKIVFVFDEALDFQSATGKEYGIHSLQTITTGALLAVPELEALVSSSDSLVCQAGSLVDTSSDTRMAKQGTLNCLSIEFQSR